MTETEKKKDTSASNSKMETAYSVNLDIQYALGFRRTSGTTATHVDEECIVYLAGRHVTKYNHENHTHTFLLQQPKVAEVVCFCVSSNCKYIAVSEKMTDGALQVSIYSLASLTKVRTLKFEFISTMAIVSMCFSHDNKYLATVTAMPLMSNNAAPEVFVYLWQLDKSWLLCMLNIAMEVTQITVSPWSFASIACTGSSGKYGGCKLLKYADKSFGVTEPLLRAKGKDSVHLYTCHAWVDDEVMVVGTEEGDLIVVERAEYRELMHHVHGEGNAVCVVHSIARGFVCGGENGIFSIFERSMDSDSTYFTIYKKFQDPSRHRIIAISIAPSEQNAVLCYVNNSMAHFALDNIDILRDDDPSCFALLGNGFHRDFITAADACLQKSFVVTASIDHTVRIWNYARKKVELAHNFDDEVFSVAVHPTGLRIVVGFKFCMRMYNVLNDGLHLCCEFPVKQCYEVRFSPGGQYFAAVVVSRILIFNSYDFVCLGPLPGNTSVVKSICWSKDDRHLVSAEVNGVIFLWDIDEMKSNQQEDGRKNISYTCVCYDDTTTAIAALGCNRLAEQGLPEGDVCIRNLIPNNPTNFSSRMGYVHPNLQRREHTCEMALSLLCQTLFVGTPSGALLLFRWPVKDNDQPAQRIEIHNGGILLVQLTPDDRYLFTIGDDNVMFMMEVSAMIDGRPVVFKEFNAAPFEEVTYVLQEQIDKTVVELDELQRKVVSVQQETLEASQTIRDRHNRELMYTKKHLEDEVGDLRSTLDRCLLDKEGAIESIRDNSRHLEGQHIKSAEDLEQSYAQRSQEANVAYNKLKLEREDMIVRQESKIFKLAKEQAAEKALLVERVKSQEHDLEQDIEELRRHHAAATKRTDQMLDMAIEEYERNIDDVTARNTNYVQNKQDEHSKTAMRTHTYRKACEGLDEELKDLRIALDRDEKEFRDKEEKIDKRKKESETYKKEMSVRNETIAASERKIGQLKKQTAELEKLRYVLTFKLTELKKEVHPKDEQIKVLNTRVDEMSREHDKVCTDRVTLEQAKSAKEDKLRVILADIDTQKVVLLDKERIIVAMLQELTELTKSDELSDMIFSLKDIVMKFNVKYSCDDATVHKDRTGDFERQRDHMEAQLASISKQNLRKEEYLLQDNHRKTTENALLVREINELRHELKYLGGKMALSDVQLKEAKVAVSRATSSSPLVNKTPAGGATPASSKKVKALRNATSVDSAKIAEIIAQVETNNIEMERQQEEIHTLRSYVQVLLSHLEQGKEGPVSPSGGPEAPPSVVT